MFLFGLSVLVLIFWFRFDFWCAYFRGYCCISVYDFLKRFCLVLYFFVVFFELFSFWVCSVLFFGFALWLCFSFLFRVYFFVSLFCLVFCL